MNLDFFVIFMEKKPGGRVVVGFPLKSKLASARFCENKSDGNSVKWLFARFRFVRAGK